jgi:RNA polymerase sigma factor for flagellar operon FliA
MHRGHARYATEGENDAAVVTRYGALIDRAARRLSARTGGAVPADDLWSAGAMGLLEASRRYDATREVRFETFAEHRIRGAMLDELRRLDHLPRRLRAQTEAVDRARSALTQRLQREPSAEELAAEVALDVEELASVVALGEPTVGADDLPAPVSPPDDQVERTQLAAAVTSAVAALPERLRLLLSLHYVEGLTYREIAQVLEVSEPRVCQLHADAMRRLREALRSPCSLT